MRIYEFDGGANPKRLRAFLSEKGILDDIEFVCLDIAKGENREPEFKRKNSKGTLPVLELDDGTIITEGVAICRYFELTNPDPSLMGTSATEQAIVEMWNRRIELGLFRCIEDVVRNTNDFFKDIVIQREEVAEVGRKTAAQECEWLDAELIDRRYVAGDRFSIADITLGAVFYLGVPSIIEVNGSYKNIARWYDHVSKRDSFELAFG